MSAQENTDPHEHTTGHVHDGIREDDHPLPMWWLGTFFVTVAFALAYWFWYHSVEAGSSLTQLYEADITALPKAGSAGHAADDTLSALDHDEEAIARGRAVYLQSCVACHLGEGQGSIGANLTDGYWLHGSTPKDVLRTISDGVAAKGMPAWGTILGEKKLLDVYAFVRTLRNKNVAGGKAPQGVDESGNPAPVP